MKREEAIKLFRREIECLSHDKCSDCILEYGCDPMKTPPDSEYIEAYGMAIEALSAEPCEDAISRQSVIDTTICEGISCNECSFNTLEDGESGCLLSERVTRLPSVTPKQKMGRWIMPVQDDGMSDPIYYQVRCSECGFDLDPQTWHMELHQHGADKYCPNCGANMEESEDKV